MLSICQDLASNVTKLPMPKHVGLAVHISSRDLVTILNRFGHCISLIAYIASQRYITAMAKKIEPDTALHGVFIPEYLNGVFFHVLLTVLTLLKALKMDLPHMLQVISSTIQQRRTQCRLHSCCSIEYVQENNCSRFNKVCWAGDRCQR